MKKIIFLMGVFMNELEVKIENLIYEVRGKQVMLDSDLARIYHCKNGTKEINQAVKRNINRFPSEFCFQLTNEEYTNLKSQIVTSKLSSHGGVRKLPFVFTEHGIIMLSSLIKSDIAIRTNIEVINAFIKMKNYLSNSLIEQNFYKNMLLDHDDRIKILENNFSDKRFSNEIFYEGEIYDAYSLLLDIINSAKKSIIIIDNYVSKELLDLLSNTKKNIIVYSKNINDSLINKYNSQYDNVTFKVDNRFHDRFIIVDNKDIYHSGASFKDLGKKCFAISKISDEEIINSLLSSLHLLCKV